MRLYMFGLINIQSIYRVKTLQVVIRRYSRRSEYYVEQCNSIYYLRESDAFAECLDYSVGAYIG